MLLNKLARKIVFWGTFPVALGAILGVLHVTARLLFVEMDIFHVSCAGDISRCTYDSYDLLTGVKSFDGYTSDFGDIFMSHTFAFLGYAIIALILMLAYGAASCAEDMFFGWSWSRTNKKWRRKQDSRAMANN